MKHIITLIVLLALSSASQAATSLRFLPLNMNALVIVSGQADNDFSDLYKIMNVPEQDSSMGKGKAIKTDDKAFNLVCSLNRALCQVVLNKHSSVVIDPQSKYLKFTAEGTLAAALKAQFLTDTNGELSFTSSDRKFRLYADQSVFVFEASESGLAD